MDQFLIIPAVYHQELSLNRIIVGLDIGSSFVRAVIGEVINDGENSKIEIIGSAQRPSAGLRNGVIVNRDLAMECIRQCIENAEQKAGEEVTACVTAIGGTHIESMNSTGLVAIASHGKGQREVIRSDVERVLDAANAINIPMDRKMLHVIPQVYIIDDEMECKNPLGNIACRLSAKVHIITASKTGVANMTQCIERAGYGINNVMLNTLAGMHAVMGQDERELGSVLIDLGGGTTDAIVIKKDAPVCTVSIPIGGNLVTNDIATVKGTSPQAAEKIKIEQGCCWGGVMDGDGEVIIPRAGGRSPEVCSRSEICLGIIEPRMREILTMVRNEVINKADTTLAGNIILTGGGAMMPGIVQLTEDVFGTSAVRLGTPGDLGGLQEEYRRPDYATSIGLVLGYMGEQDSGNKKGNRDSEESSGEGIFAKVTGFLKNCF